MLALTEKLETLGSSIPDDPFIQSQEVRKLVDSMGTQHTSTKGIRGKLRWSRLTWALLTALGSFAPPAHASCESEIVATAPGYSFMYYDVLPSRLPPTVAGSDTFNARVVTAYWDQQAIALRRAINYWKYALTDTILSAFVPRASICLTKYGLSFPDTTLQMQAGAPGSPSPVPDSVAARIRAYNADSPCVLYSLCLARYSTWRSATNALRRERAHSCKAAIASVQAQDLLIWRRSDCSGVTSANPFVLKDAHGTRRYRVQVGLFTSVERATLAGARIRSRCRTSTTITPVSLDGSVLKSVLSPDSAPRDGEGP